MAKRIDPATLTEIVGTLYPDPYDEPCRGRKKLGDAAGLTQYGINLLRLPPGAWSSQRHWHSTQDEFVYVLSGEVVLVTVAGEEVLSGGDCAGFAVNDDDGHHPQNRSAADALMLEIGTRTTPTPWSIPMWTWPCPRTASPRFIRTRTVCLIPASGGAGPRTNM